MASIKDYSDAQVSPAAMPSAANHYDLLSTNEAGLRLGIFGDREGAINGHNHTNRGGRLLTRSVTTLSLGPYSRPGSGLTPTPGLPVYPPVAGLDFGDSGGLKYKLLHHQGVYLAGGVYALRVRAGVNFTGAGVRSFNLAIVLRPLERICLKFYQPQYATVSTTVNFSTNGATNLLNQDVQLAPLTRFGNVNAGRWYELLIVLISNPTVTTTPRLIGVSTYPLINAPACPPPSSQGLPAVTVDPREYQSGAFVVEKLFKQAVSLFDGLILATLGRIPGKWVDWGQALALEDKASAYRQAIQDLDSNHGIHQHTGALFGDGALIPSQLVTIAPVDDSGDTAASEMDGNPPKGPLVDPTGAGSGTPTALKSFKCRVPIARGDTKLFLRVALAPGHSDEQGNCYVLMRSRQVLAANVEAAVKSINLADAPFTDVDPDIITSLELGQDTLEATGTKAGGSFWVLRLTPEDCDVYKTNAVRAAQGKVGNWTEAAMMAAENLTSPDDLPAIYSAGQFRTYRVSKVVTINVNPKGRTGDVMFDFRFFATNQAGTVKTTARLQWLALVRPEQL